jgi:hypothetical protein
MIRQTTENRKDAVVPLHPSLAAELRQSFSQNADPSARVFPVNQYMCRTFKKRFEAGEDRTLRRDEAQTRFPCSQIFILHSARLERCFATAHAGVDGHSDANLTARVYTDASRLPIFDAVALLDWEGDSYTQPCTQSSGAERPGVSPTGTNSEGRNDAKPFETEPSGLVLTPSVTNGRMVEPRGFEPLTPTMPLWCSTN